MAEVISIWDVLCPYYVAFLYRFVEICRLSLFGYINGNKINDCSAEAVVVVADFGVF
jgi:hypothetical protein